MKLKPTDEYHADDGCCLFVNFSRDENGVILGEPPEVDFKSGYLEDGFDEDKWTHYVEGDFNFLFTDADPVNFPVNTAPRSSTGAIDSPWPARDVVQKLVDASGILLDAKGYDGHGYEEICAARDVALEWLK